MQRPPAVAGQFYPGQQQALQQMVVDLLGPPVAERSALAVVVPHAGYVYSGGIAGQTFAGIKVPERVVVLGPNHHGVGQPAAVYAEGSWLTPLGEVPIDQDLAGRILNGCPELTADTVAHRHEHSLEVQIPFLQLKKPHVRMVPICLGHGTLSVLLKIGRDLGTVLADQEEDVLLVASSDMTHYEAGDIARTKDLRALERVLALDAEGLYRTVRDQGITMCGVIPVTVMLAAARVLGARKATLIRYGNSGDVTGDQSDVVGYAGVVVEG